MNALHRNKLKLAGLLALSLAGCAAGRVPASSDMTLVGVLTRRGAQVESWFGVRAADGQLWRLEPANAKIADQLTQLLQQNVQLKGEVITTAMPLPVFRVREVLAIK